MWKHLSPFVLGAATGLAFLAYNHHEFYDYVSKALSLLAMLVFLGTSAWNAALLSARIRLYKVLPLAENERMRTTLESIEVPFTFVAAYIATMAYVWLLTYLPTPK